MDFNEWFHRQSPPDETLHQELLPGVESDWRGRFADAKHDDMSQVPSYIAQDTSKNMWSHGVAKLTHMKTVVFSPGHSIMESHRRK